MFHGTIHYKLSFSIAMLNYQRVPFLWQVQNILGDERPMVSMNAYWDKIPRFFV